MKKIFILTLILICYIQNSKGDEVFNLFEKAKKNLQFQENIYLNQEYYNQKDEALRKSRFLDLNSNISYSRIKATKLQNFYDISTINISNNIDIFNKTKYDLKINEFEKEKAEFLIQKEQQQLFKNILDLYTSLLLYNQLINLQQENIEWIQKNLKFTKDAIQHELFPPVEEDKWKSKLLTEEEKLINYKENKDLIEKNLKILTGVNDIKLEEINIPEKIEDLENIQNKILERYPDLKILNLDKFILETDYQKEKNYWYPNLSIFYEYQINKDPTGNGNQNLIGTSINFKILNGATKYNLLSIKTKEKSIDILQQREKLRIIQEINSIYSSLSDGLKRLPLIQQKYSILKEILDKYQKAYQMRLVDFIMLDNYYKDYLSAKENYIQTQFKIYSNYQLLKYLATGEIYK